MKACSQVILILAVLLAAGCVSNHSSPNISESKQQRISTSSIEETTSANEQQAKDMLTRLTAAVIAKDVESVAKMLAEDFTVIMTEPGNAMEARYFTKDGYLELFKARCSALSEIESERTLLAISTHVGGYIFATTKADGKAIIAGQSEQIVSNEYIVFRKIDGKDMKIQSVVAELVTYTIEPAK